MSLLETLAFAISTDIRRETNRYEFFLEERRNPRILTPRLLQKIPIDGIIRALEQPYSYWAAGVRKLRAKVQEIV
jgi:hypothetical protein